MPTAEEEFNEEVRMIIDAKKREIDDIYDKDVFDTSKPDLNLTKEKVEQIEDLSKALKDLTENTVVNNSFVNSIKELLLKIKQKVKELTDQIAAATPATPADPAATVPGVPDPGTDASGTPETKTPEQVAAEALERQVKYYQDLLDQIIIIITKNNAISSDDSNKLFEIIKEIETMLKIKPEDSKLLSTKNIGMSYMGGSPYIEYGGGNVGILGVVIGGALGTEFINFLNKYGEIIKLIIGCILLLFILVLIERYHTKKRCMSRRNVLYINSHMM